jgi:hypothetical protein
MYSSEEVELLVNYSNDNGFDHVLLRAIYNHAYFVCTITDYFYNDVSNDHSLYSVAIFKESKQLDKVKLRDKFQIVHESYLSDFLRSIVDHSEINYREVRECSVDWCLDKIAIKYFESFEECLDEFERLNRFYVLQDVFKNN